MDSSARRPASSIVVRCIEPVLVAGAALSGPAGLVQDMRPSEGVWSLRPNHGARLQDPGEAERLVARSRRLLEMPEDEPRRDPRQPGAVARRAEREQMTGIVPMRPEKRQPVGGLVVETIPRGSRLHTGDRRIQQRKFVHRAARCAGSPRAPAHAQGLRPAARHGRRRGRRPASGPRGRVRQPAPEWRGVAPPAAGSRPAAASVTTP